LYEHFLTAIYAALHYKTNIVFNNPFDGLTPKRGYWVKLFDRLGGKYSKGYIRKVVKYNKLYGHRNTEIEQAAILLAYEIKQSGPENPAPNNQ
jgi:hypothetical protein